VHGEPLYREVRLNTPI